MSVLFGFDAFSRKEIAERVDTIGVAKARLPAFSMLILGFFRNLLPVLLRNIVGGSVLVGLIYHLIYHRMRDRNPGPE